MEAISINDWFKMFNVSSKCEIQNEYVDIQVGNTIKTINIVEEKHLAQSKNYLLNKKVKNTPSWQQKLRLQLQKL
jgi:hypothetical protein